MKNIALVLAIILLCSCQKHHKSRIAIVYYNGDKDTITAEWDGDIWFQKGRLGSQLLGSNDFASGVRTYEILTIENK